MNLIFFSALFSIPLLTAPVLIGAQAIDLPTSKQLIGEAPGRPQRMNSLPISMAISPDHRYVVTVNIGYGTFESRYAQSLAVFDTQTGALKEFPDDRTIARLSKQTLFAGLAFSHDGKHIYASMASLTNPTGGSKNALGSGIAVYGFNDGVVTPERLIPLPMVQLPANHKTLLIGEKEGDKGIPYPAAIAVLGGAGSEQLLVAENYTDDVMLLDAATGAIKARFDLSESNMIPATYPIALAIAKGGSRAFVALWNASEIVELDLKKQTVGRKLALLKPTSPTAAGTHPSAFAFSPDERTLYVALSNRDAIAAVNVAPGQFSVKVYFDTRLPRQSYFGAEPVAVAVNSDGSRLYAANMASDAVAVIDTRKLTAKISKQGMVEPDGFVPTEWMPMSMAYSRGRIFVATDKGKGTGANNFPQQAVPGAPNTHENDRTYIPTLLYGSVAAIDESEIAKNLPHWTQVVLESNRMKATAEKISFANGSHDRIKHVIYIIKENRTYDQILGDLTKDGQPVGNGDPSLTMYGQAITPNLHKLALQFGVLDNFFDSGEVSGDGHVWSNAAIGTDYLEKTWQLNYRGSEREYDFEGVVSEGYPLLQKIPDIVEPHSGYLWGNLAAHGKTYYHFGEYISTKFCNTMKTESPQQGPMLSGSSCERAAIAPGEKIPEEWGGGVNNFQWAIPRIWQNTATKPELVGHFATEYPDFNLMVPDQVRVAIFERHLKQWIAEREKGKDTMPSFIQLRMGNDHTAGTRPGSPMPRASVADNDLAVGRAVEAISHSPYWDDTAFFILEDDAQNGADHVDAHRSIGFVVSKYSPRAADGGPFVDHRFYSTVSMVRTMEMALGLPPMNNDDALCSVISTLFTGPGDQQPFTADYSNRDKGLIYTANKKNAVGARESLKMDFSREDNVPTDKLNVILWKDAMGDKPVPAMLKMHVKKTDKDDD